MPEAVDFLISPRHTRSSRPADGDARAVFEVRGLRTERPKSVRVLGRESATVPRAEFRLTPGCGRISRLAGEALLRFCHVEWQKSTQSNQCCGAGPSSHRWNIILGGAVIILAALAVYHNCFAVPFLLDDGPSVIQNPSIQHLWPVWSALSPLGRFDSLAVGPS